MNSAFDWSLIRSFLAALEHGSLLAASRALSATQPTIGRHIAELESQLGVVLFERTGRGLVPTDNALRLAEPARQMEASADQLARGASGASSVVSGSVRITASTPVACFLLPQVLARMRSELPQVQVELVSSNAVSNLLRREADIALRMVRPQQASLVAKKIASVSLGAYAHRDYLRRRGTPRQPADLCAHDLIADDQPQAVVRAFAKFGHALPPEALVLRCDDLVAHWHAVRAGLGVGFIADYVARTDPKVVAVVPGLPMAPLPIWLTVHREIRSSPRIRAVYDFLAQAIPLAIES